MDKKKLLSKLTIEEFEEILSNFKNELIIELKNYKSTINIGEITPPIPRYDTYQPWCSTNNIWYDGKNGTYKER